MRLLICAAFAASFSAHASLAASLEIKTQPRPLPAAMTPRDQVLVRAWCDAAPSDAFTVTVFDGSVIPPAHNYCTVNGQTAARLFTDKQHRTYVLLEFGEGRGRNADTQYLEVFELFSGQFISLLRTPLSWPTDKTDRFAFTYTPSDTPDGGLQLTLTATGTGTQSIVADDPDADQACCIPAEKKRVIRVDPVP